jgi:hypothetical protein
MLSVLDRYRLEEARRATRIEVVQAEIRDLEMSQGRGISAEDNSQLRAALSRKKRQLDRLVGTD